MHLYQNKRLRSFIIPFLKKLNLGNIHIKHHYTGTKFKLDAFTHKGYWYHGKNREKVQMDIFKMIINEGDTVFELGAHIGYISLYFSKLVGPSGKLYVFEPGANNLPYTRVNISHSKSKNITLIEKPDELHRVCFKTTTQQAFMVDLLRASCAVTVGRPEAFL